RRAGLAPALEWLYRTWIATASPSPSSEKGGFFMSTQRELPPTRRPSPVRRALRRIVSCLFVLATSSKILLAQSPWENAVNVLQISFTGPIARGLSLVSIVVGGLLFAFGEGQSKRAMAGIVFGVGMAIGAVNFMAWLFP